MPIRREGFASSLTEKVGSWFFASYDSLDALGVDYVPERWYTLVVRGFTSSRDFVLKKGVSIYLKGEVVKRELSFIDKNL